MYDPNEFFSAERESKVTIDFTAEAKELIADAIGKLCAASAILRKDNNK